MSEDLDKIQKLEIELRNLKSKLNKDKKIKHEQKVEEFLKLDWIKGHKVLLEATSEEIILDFIYFKEEVYEKISEICYHTINFTEVREDKRFLFNNKKFKIIFRDSKNALDFIKENGLEVELDYQNYKIFKITKELNKVGIFDIYEFNLHQESVLHEIF